MQALALFEQHQKQKRRQVTQLLPPTEPTSASQFSVAEVVAEDRGITPFSFFLIPQNFREAYNTSLPKNIAAFGIQ